MTDDPHATDDAAGTADGAVHVTVRLHGALAERAGGRRAVPLALPAGATVAALLDLLAACHPAVGHAVRDETGTVRRHVNVFVDTRQLRTVGGLAHTLRDGSEVLILPAVSGG